MMKKMMIMKKMLLIWMVLASAAMAEDAEMKALLVGDWTSDCNGKAFSFQEDGNQISNSKDPEKWDIKDGLFIEIPTNGESRSYFKILLLTKHEFLLQNTSEPRDYLFYTRY
jgi:hypothetical protein